MTSDEQAILHLLFGYAERIDRGDLTGMARMFEHSEYRAGEEAPIRDWREVERINRTLMILYEDGTPKTQHVTTNVQIEIEEGGLRARTRAYFTVLQGVPGSALQPIVAGRYHDQFTKVDGRWRFSARHILMDHVGDLTRHLHLDRPARLQAQPAK